MLVPFFTFFEKIKTKTTRKRRKRDFEGLNFGAVNLTNLATPHFLRMIILNINFFLCMYGATEIQLKSRPFTGSFKVSNAGQAKGKEVCQGSDGVATSEFFGPD